MIKIEDKSKCSGCHACYSICPKNCIEMTKDVEGYLYPKVDESLCIDCNLCVKVCPINNDNNKDYTHPNKIASYAVINKNENIRKESSSGGVFSAIAEFVLKNNGVVFGAAFDENLNVKHICVDDESKLYKLRGSKYLQSTIGDTLQSVKKELLNGTLVLFTGTPCQISGLKRYLVKDYDNLICQDIICHGVPSPNIWQKYLDFITKKQKSEIDKSSKPSFRNKTYGWNKFSVALNCVDGTQYIETLDKDLFMKSFLSNLNLRPSCYDCHSKSLQRESDITLADFWGIENLMPEMCDDKGTSLIFINSDKGKKLIDSIKNKLDIKEVNIDNAIKYNPSAYKSVNKPDNRDEFFNDIFIEDFDKVVKRYTKEPTKIIIKRKVKNTIKKVLRIRN